MNDDHRHGWQARNDNLYLTTQQAAFHLGIAYITLKRLRRADKGPRCRRHGKVWRYHIDDLEAWSAANSRGGPGKDERHD